MLLLPNKFIQHQPYLFQDILMLNLASSFYPNLFLVLLYVCERINLFYLSQILSSFFLKKLSYCGHYDFITINLLTSMPQFALSQYLGLLQN